MNTVLSIMLVYRVPVFKILYIMLHICNTTHSNCTLNKFKNICFQAHAQILLMATSCFDKSFAMLPEVRVSLQALWQDRGVRLAVARGYEYELNDSAI